MESIRWKHLCSSLCLIPLTRGKTKDMLSPYSPTSSKGLPADSLKVSPLGKKGCPGIPQHPPLSVEVPPESALGATHSCNGRRSLREGSIYLKVRGVNSADCHSFHHPSQRGLSPAPQRPALSAKVIRKWNQFLSFFVQSPRFRRLYGRGGRNLSMLSAHAAMNAQQARDMDRTLRASAAPQQP
jgi:hypothetical protein